MLCFSHPYFKVKYEDGDEEELTAGEVKPLLVPQEESSSSHSPPLLQSPPLGQHEKQKKEQQSRSASEILIGRAVVKDFGKVS